MITIKKIKNYISPKKILTAFIFSILSLPVFADTSCVDAIAQWMNTRPLYIGFSTGYGNTNWSGLVDPDAVNDGSDGSTPINATSGGIVWGVFGGVEFSPYFSLQGNFKRYPDAKLLFDQYNLYFPQATEITSRTTNYSVIGKFMVPILGSRLRAFSDLGPAYTYRHDVLYDKGNWAVTFGGGFNFLVTHHLITELNFDYTSGNGKSNTLPVDDFVPFLYSINFAIGYRFIV